MLKGTIRLLLFLVLCQGVSAEESTASTKAEEPKIVYVHDMLRLGVRAIPDANEGSIAVVSTGDALTVLAEQEGYLNIRTANGVEGWVSKGYISSTPPARNLLPQVQKELNQLQQAHQQLQQTHQALQQKLTGVQRQLKESTASEEEAKPGEELAQLQEQNAQLQQQLEQLQQAPVATPVADGTPPGTAPVATTGGSAVRVLKQTLTMLVLVLLSIAAGFAYGVHWKARRVAERIGGLQI